MKVGYCRVSTTKAEQDISIAGQQKQLVEAGCEEVISERKSAYKGRRPGWTKLWALVASDKVSEVLVVDQSRLSRSGDDLEFLEACALNKVTVRALSGGVIEVSSIGGFVQAGILSVVNRAQSKIIGAKVADGLARRRAAGHYAVGMVPFGFAYVDGVVVPHPENWDKARDRWDRLVGMEMNIHGFCRKYKDCSVSGLKNWIENPMLRGIVPHQQGGVKPLISPEEWQQAQRMLKHRATTRTSSAKRQHLLSGLVVCDSCGRSLWNQVAASGQLRLKCHYAPCQWFGRGIAVEVVRAQLIQVLRDNAGRLADEAQLASTATGLEMTEAQSAVTAQIAQLEALQDSGVPDLDRSLESLRSELKALQRPVSGPDWSGLAELIGTPGVLERFPDQQLRPLLLEYVAQCRYVGNPREVEVILEEGQR